MTERDDLMHAFIIDAGCDAATKTMVAGDASNRKYFRLHREQTTVILMDAPPEKGEDVRPFIRITDWLRSQGLSAPEIYAADDENGFLLLEDLGPNLFARLLEAGRADETELYETACDVLLAIAQGDAPNLARYDAQTMAPLSALSVDWYRSGVTGSETPDLSATLADMMRARLTVLDHAPRVLIQRDYHAENLIWLPDRDGPARVGLLDFQDAMLGHPAYDLVSILQDARRDVSPDVQASAYQHYIQRSQMDTQEFSKAYYLSGLQRNLRIVGVFARLSLRDGKPSYVDLIPRVWGHVLHNLQSLEDAELSDCVLSILPEPTTDGLKRLKRA
ncbi:aminoglycoside phosphotransferase [Aliishimia ponticola]|uniref:Aminoglycoside phosphotransferase n=1 Tax=Aliishimia ponticola TaxID=2499833 RepID=A0A4S4N973_9RHOB|nr:phosphotransferase [Aliishimia ponticola]THH34628.1 aminoglycoside phosphotransferase [Aliishimia ponticola]